MSQVTDRVHPATGRNEHGPRKRLLLRAALLSFLLAACGCSPRLIPVPTARPASLVYHNAEYGFSFDLPASWAGYSVIPDTWIGTVSDPSKGDVPATQGPLISIRHPAWSAQQPRQDIPIMVFTLAQWQALQRQEFVVGAAPIGPTELGRNAAYVFALPARYNYAFPEGWQEVEQILSAAPLHTP